MSSVFVLFCVKLLFFLSSEFGNQRYEVSHVHKVECVVPWLNDALVFFTVSLQLCQQLKDKVTPLEKGLCFLTLDFERISGLKI